MRVSVAMNADSHRKNDQPFTTPISDAAAEAGGDTLVA